MWLELVSECCNCAIVLRSGLGRQHLLASIGFGSTGEPPCYLTLHAEGCRSATGAASPAPPSEEQQQLGSAGLAAGRAAWPPQKVKLQSLRSSEVGQERFRWHVSQQRAERNILEQNEAPDMNCISTSGMGRTRSLAFGSDLPRPQS